LEEIIVKSYCTWYQNDFNFVDYGSQTRTKGNLFALNIALIDSKIPTSFAIASMVFRFEDN
jgi:hypothetical protein